MTPSLHFFRAKVSPKLWSWRHPKFCWHDLVEICRPSGSFLWYIVLFPRENKFRSNPYHREVFSRVFYHRISVLEENTVLMKPLRPHFCSTPLTVPPNNTPSYHLCCQCHQSTDLGFFSGALLPSVVCMSSAARR